MASNPVFRQFDRNLRSGQYAVVGSPAPVGNNGGFSFPTSGVPGPSYQPQVTPAGVTMGDVTTRALAMFAVVLVVAATAWTVTVRSMEAGTGLGGLLWLGGMIVTLVLGVIIAFMRTVPVPLILLYAVAEGAFLGAVSATFDSMYPGVVRQAVIATMCVLGGVLLGYRLGVIRVTSRSRRIFMFLLIGYTLFALVNFILVWTGVLGSFGVGGTGPLGLIISVVAVLLASYSLAVDFDSIDDAIRMGAPRKTAWTLAFGLMVTLVWLYVELLRLFARSRD